MMQVSFELEHDDGADVYARVWLVNTADVGKCFDFDAGELDFKAVGSAVEGYIVATEYTQMGDGAGATKSGYIITLDLDDIAPGPALLQLRVKWYDNATPAATDLPIGREDIFFARFGRFGHLPVEAKCEISHTTSAGTTAHIAAWLECGGELVTGIDDLDASATVSVVAKELTAGSTLFTKAGTVADLVNDVFQLSQSTPGFTSDRQYILTPTIVIDGVTFAANIHNRVVIG